MKLWLASHRHVLGTRTVILIPFPVQVTFPKDPAACLLEEQDSDISALLRMQLLIPLPFLLTSDLILNLISRYSQLWV